MTDRVGAAKREQIDGERKRKKERERRRRKDRECS